MLVTVLIGAIGLSAYPVSNGETALGEEWLEAPLVGIAAAFDGSLPTLVVDALRGRRRDLGRSHPRRCRGDLVLGNHAPHAFARASTARCRASSRASSAARVVSSEAIAIAAALAVGLIVLTEVAADGDPAFLASLYSFGVLIAFTAAQLAVIRLRMRVPELARPFRVRPNLSVRGHSLPLAALVGAPLTLTIWVLAMVTHSGARYAGPVWLALGLVVFVAVRRKSRTGLLEHVAPLETLPAATEFQRILVPMKLGDIGEEMVATAIALAKERGAAIDAITVVRVPRKFGLEGELPASRRGPRRRLTRRGSRARRRSWRRGPR